MADLVAGVREVYFEGNVEGGVALSGEVAGRIEKVEPVAEIISRAVREYAATVARMAESVRG
jgi:enoyl-[acyl-carrier protein] reductase II